jgi:ABC-type antimicrobial peptide transport system permease subunit
MAAVLPPGLRDDGMLAMTTVWFALRADVRRRWPALLSLALLLGLIGGVVLTAAAGARRTDTAYPRLLTWANATQTQIIPEGNGIAADYGNAPDYFAALRKQPHIAALTNVGLYGAVVSRNDPTSVDVMSSPDGAMGVTVDRVKILAGRQYDPRVPGQAMVDPQLASLEHLTPGSTLRLYGVPSAPSGRPEYDKAVTLTYRVTAIVVFDDEIVPTGTNNATPTALVSWPFAAAPVAVSLASGYEAAVRLTPGASQAMFSSAAQNLARHYPDTAGNVITINLSDQVNATERAIKPEAIALAVFAGLAGLIALAVIGQLLSRQLALDAAEFPILRALGVRRPALITLSLARLGIVTVTGAIVAVAVAVAASPLMPIGPARLAEPHPGVQVNIAILGAGFAAIALLPLAVLVPPAWRAARQAQGPLGLAEPTARQSRPSRLAAALTHAGSVTGGAGVAMAFEPGHGKTAVPVRSALAGSVIAVAALAAAAVFGASLVGLVSTPHDYGQNWVQEVDLNFGSAPGADAAQLTKAIPSVGGYAAGDYGQLTINGVIVPAIGLDQVRGSGYLTLLAGRAPTAPDEIALGEQTLRAIGAHLGQTIQVTVNEVTTAGPAIRHPMRIVGVTVLPAFSRGGFSPTGLGTGAVVPASVLYSVVEAQSQTAMLGCKRGEPCYNFFLLRYRPGANLAAEAAKITSVLRASGCPVGSCDIPAVADQRPGDIKNYASIRDTPLALAVVLALLAIATLAHALLTGVRRRRRDLALLKTLGFTRRQVLGTVAWEASTFATGALLIGLPLGVVAGRWAWSLFANAAGVYAAPTVPLTTVLLVIPATLLAANLIAAAPGWEAARLRPAIVLRTE